MMNLPNINLATKLKKNIKRLFIGAYGFEDRSTGWLEHQQKQGIILDLACMIKYKNPKGRNRIKRIRQIFEKIGINQNKITEIVFDVKSPFNIETNLSERLLNLLTQYEEIVIDISAMTKLLILVVLFQLIEFKGTVRIVYSEAREYAPTEDEYRCSENDMRMIARFPSSGIESIVRQNCLSSVRMQGQPVALIAFTSFNEQLVRHMLGTINPHRILFINGRSPRKEFSWREIAKYEIHKKIIEEYPDDNEIIRPGVLKRTVSTLYYRETVNGISEIMRQYSTHERIIAIATGSKMQTVGLFFSKIIYPDIHIEYPTPDSYFVEGHSKGIQNIYEIKIPIFSEFIENIKILDNRRWS